MAIRASWLPLYAALLCSLFLLFRPPEPVYADQDVGGLVAGAKVVAPEMVTNVARGASDTAATVSIGFDGWGPYGSAGSGDVEARLRYGTAPGQWASTVTECDGDGVAGCVGEPGELLTFSLTGLTTGQEYHYQIETRRPSGSGTQALWTPRPAGRFVASRPETGFVSFTFLHFSDTHTGAAFPRAECGNADDAASLTLYRTMARMAQERADFSLDTGDTAALRSPIAFACNELGGLSTGDDPQGAPGEPISTGLARWRLTLQHPRLYANLLRLGGAFAIALGNHEGETGFDSTCTTGSSPPGTCSVPTYCNGGSRDGLSCWTGGFGCPGGGTCEPLPCASDECDNVGVPRYDFDEHGTGHYAHSGPSGESQKQLARDARVQVMPPWTTGSGHTDGYYYAFDWGNSRFIVMDPFAFYDPSVKAWGHPEWPEDWMMGSAQWAWAQARIDECEADADCDFVFVGTHHIVGGHQVEGKWYHYGRHCMKGTDCLDSDDQDGSIDEDFRGEHALLQAYLKAAVDSGGITAGIVLLGHDHLGAWGEKQDAGGGSGIWYVSATQAVDTAWSAQCSGGTFAGSPCADAGDCPGGGTCDSLAGGPRGGPNWSENPTALDGFDYDADGTAQYRENPLDAAAPGSLLRGYHRVTVNESPPSVTFEAIGSQIIETGSGATKPDPQDGTVLFDLDVSSFWETRLDQLTGCANNDPLPFAVSQDGDDVDETSDSLWLACSLAMWELYQAGDVDSPHPHGSFPSGISPQDADDAGYVTTLANRVVDELVNGDGDSNGVSGASAILAYIYHRYRDTVAWDDETTAVQGMLARDCDVSASPCFAWAPRVPDNFNVQDMARDVLLGEALCDATAWSRGQTRLDEQLDRVYERGPDEGNAPHYSSHFYGSLPLALSASEPTRSKVRLLFDFITLHDSLATKPAKTILPSGLASTPPQARAFDLISARQMAINFGGALLQLLDLPTSEPTSLDTRSWGASVLAITDTEPLPIVRAIAAHQGPYTAMLQRDRNAGSGQGPHKAFSLTRPSSSGMRNGPVQFLALEASSMGVDHGHNRCDGFTSGTRIWAPGVTGGWVGIMWRQPSEGNQYDDGDFNCGQLGSLSHEGDTNHHDGNHYLYPWAAANEGAILSTFEVASRASLSDPGTYPSLTRQRPYFELWVPNLDALGDVSGVALGTKHGTWPLAIDGGTFYIGELADTYFAVGYFGTEGQDGAGHADCNAPATIDFQLDPMDGSTLITDLFQKVCIESNGAVVVIQADTSEYASLAAFVSDVQGRSFAYNASGPNGLPEIAMTANDENGTGQTIELEHRNDGDYARRLLNSSPLAWTDELSAGGIDSGPCAGTFCDWNEGTDRVEIAHDDHPTVELDMPALIGTTYALNEEICPAVFTNAGSLDFGGSAGQKFETTRDYEVIIGQPGATVSGPHSHGYWFKFDDLAALSDMGYVEISETGPNLNPPNVYIDEPGDAGSYEVVVTEAGGADRARTSVDPSEWNCLIWTHHSSERRPKRLYLNGAYVGQVNTTTSYVADDGPFIAALGYAPNYPDMKIDEVFIYDEYIDEVEAQEICGMGGAVDLASVHPSNLLAWYRFEDSGDLDADSSGNDEAASITSGITSADTPGIGSNLVGDSTWLAAMESATEICPGCSLTDYYFDWTAGSDSNDCTDSTTNVCKGENAKRETICVPGARCLFKRGETFVDTDDWDIDITSSATGEPYGVIIGAYGTGDRPVFQCADTTGGQLTIDGENAAGEAAAIWGIRLECDNMRPFGLGYTHTGGSVSGDRPLVVLADVVFVGTDPDSPSHKTVDNGGGTLHAMNSLITNTGRSPACSWRVNTESNFIDVDILYNGGAQEGISAMEPQVDTSAQGAARLMLTRSRVRLNPAVGLNNDIHCFNLAFVDTMESTRVFGAQLDISSCDSSTNPAAGTGGAFTLTGGAIGADADEVEVTLYQGHADNIRHSVHFATAPGGGGGGWRDFRWYGGTVGCTSGSCVNGIAFDADTNPTSRRLFLDDWSIILDGYSSDAYRFVATETSTWSTFDGLLTAASVGGTREAPATSSGGAYTTDYGMLMQGACLPERTLGETQTTPICLLYPNRDPSTQAVGYAPSW